MNNIPNWITGSRMILALLLLLPKPLGAVYITIYLLCGLTDVLDGVLARRMGMTSERGARLDSAADLMFIGAVLFTLIPALKLDISYVIWIAIIGAVKLASIVTGFLKFGVYAGIHTYGNKAAGILVFTVPLLLPYVQPSLPVSVACFVATLTAIEEWMMLLLSSRLEPDRKGLFFKG
ncbi:CDP-alcohol phosphatidyltransferase family protein [Paenibacillus sp. HN-1]|uniref:CDP-alcohol phosphatidyltransferase family protein n=1 Tax=Paenibacillus TaxID=44249 RepID=UPI001CA97DF0|nr:MULTISPECIES: CDP-alcohol phosphatidyltransferase family protein [Paenibacillus]MBY9081792.1 CDP-alcohol phosphatidyltransferase family protein [Paenibacillus sp. CGMCC 1.18879]MBY9086511.1 CDP-alcohol phosphatidyltransferase family protein [Paenibacillus sinensis]